MGDPHQGVLVSIVVPCRDEEAELPRFLTSLAAQRGIGGAVEILFADGRSIDGTRELLEAYASSHPEVTILDNPEGIVPTGLNRAIRRARGEFIVRMDTHTRYADDYVAMCVRVIRETHAANVGGPALAEATGLWPRAIAAAFASPFAVGSARSHFAGFEGCTDTVTYGCWRRDTLLRIGLFDETLVRNQDDELNLRLRRAGATIWQTPRIRSWYRPRESLRRLFQQYYQYGFWKVAVLRKHTFPASWRHLAPGAFFASLLLLGALAPVLAVARRALAAELVAYVAFLAVGSASIAARAGWDLFWSLPPTLACYHAAYGLGFLHGALRGRRAVDRAAMSSLSR